MHYILERLLLVLVHYFFLVNYQPLVRVQCLAHRCTDIALYILVQHPWAKLIKSAASSASCSNHRCHQDIIPDQITFT